MAIIGFIGGLVLLVLGAEALVRGASRLATAAGLSPLVVGLTVVAFGTSAPELAVSVKASLFGQADVALGNVVGSNIFNVFAILGLSAIITPLAVSSQLVRLDVPVMVGVSVLAWLLAYDGVVSRLDGSMLSLVFFGYTAFLLLAAKKPGTVGTQITEVKPDIPIGSMSGAILMALVGLALLVLGSRLLVDAAVVFAKAAGVSEIVVSLTIVAAGTSLPEVVTSVVASLRGERDIAVGNVVGSNIFNLLCVLSIAGIVSPTGIHVSPEVLRFDFPVMILASVACLPIFITRHSIDRWEGALLLGLYVAYVSYLIVSAT
ncbi:calcium/sodium antiporter [Bythopirellula polymerisocia]|uniref:Inner membrane protein YrbG n=1 Tax=Bythopirellula polymerisocia TaxID=2528003 RepID=A0A5C6CA19_9BACT|nr:calcium/sodium antiporter [Bythopirellula polymerisocia]TWU20331.1 Inner membrane protein YrbG [Bythopirellula polymerisocia]